MLKRWLALSLVLILALSLPACGKGGGESSGASGEDPSASAVSAPDPEYPVRVESYIVNARPGKVISLAPALTEKLCDLGFEKRLTGISDYCDSPSSVVNLPRYGTSQLPDTDGILASAPHLVLAAEEPPEEAMNALKDAGIPVVVLGHSRSLVELEETYLTLSALMEGRTSGRAMGQVFVDKFETRLDDLARRNDERQGMNAVYLWELDYTMATGDSLEGDFLERIGFVNIAADEKEFVFNSTRANAEEGREKFRSIEMIFCDESIVNIKMLEQSAFWKGLNCVLKDYYVYIDSAIFERQSMRMLDEVERMLDGVEEIEERIAGNS